jgi:hypothetical protein
LLYGLFFVICLGLGYPTLNRYDPRKALPDSASYASLVTHGPGQVEGYFRYRVLEPYLARPIYQLARGHVGSWDPLYFSFLIVNSLFVAGTAYLTFALGTRVANPSVALLGATLFLLNFATSNALLAGLVDAGEGFFLMAVIASLFFECWYLLPVFGVLGALTKESFVPFSIVMVGTWGLLAKPFGQRRRQHDFCFAALVVAELAAIVALQSTVLGRLVWPWNFAAGLNSHSNHAMNFLASLSDKDSWYILIWVLPLGLMRIRRFPRPWIWAAAVAAILALVLNAYHTLPGAEGGVGRYVFNVAGPLLSLSTARFLYELLW